MLEQSDKYNLTHNMLVSNNLICILKIVSIDFTS